MTPYADLLVWWAVTITAGTMFLVMVSFFIYFNGGEGRINGNSVWGLGMVKNFVFVWIMLGLLALYIVSISGGSYTLFAAGNLVVEAILAVYVLVQGKAKGPANH